MAQPCHNNVMMVGTAVKQQVIRIENVLNSPNDIVLSRSLRASATPSSPMTTSYECVPGGGRLPSLGEAVRGAGAAVMAPYCTAARVARALASAVGA